MWLSDRECLGVSTQYTNVTDSNTDGLTDGWTDRQTDTAQRLLHSIVQQKTRVTMLQGSDKSDNVQPFQIQYSIRM